MKRIFLSFIMILCVLFTVVCFASAAYAAPENEEIIDTGTEKSAISEYVTEKIMPVAAGVLTSVCVFVGSLWKIGQTLSSMKNSKELFGKAQTGIDKAVENIGLSVKNEVSGITEQTKTLPELLENVAELKNETEILIRECKTLAKMISIGFGASRELVKNGSAREIQRLTEASDEILSSVSENSGESV